MSSSRHHILAISPAEKIEIYWVGDNRGTVNTPTSPHISDQLGTENTCCADLSSWHEFWFAIIWINMNVISDLSTEINNFLDGFDWNKCVNTDRIENPFYWNITTRNNSSSDASPLK